MKIQITLFFSLSLILSSLISCGSKNDVLREFDSAVLDALRQKKQIECLTENTNAIKGLQNKVLSIFARAQVGNFWELTYARDNTNSETDDANRVTQVYIDGITGNDELTELSFLVVNENGNDGENETGDQKRFFYNIENQFDHIQLLAVQACSDGEDLIITDSRIEFRSIQTNKTIKFLVDDIYPAFLARFFSHDSQIRSNDSDDQLGDTTANIQLTTRFEETSVIPSASSSIEDCTGQFTDIVFNTINPVTGETEVDTNLSNDQKQSSIFLLPTADATLESTFRFQTDLGIIGC